MKARIPSFWMLNPNWWAKKMSKTDVEIAEGYIALQHAPKESQEYDTLFWAFEEMCNVVELEPDRALKLILMILGKDDRAEVVQILAAGPLEDLLAGHGEAMIGKIEEEALGNPKFAFLLGEVWPSSIAKNVWRSCWRLVMRDKAVWPCAPTQPGRQAIQRTTQNPSNRTRKQTQYRR